MVGKDDDIERLLREMEALTAQADDVLGGDDASAKGVARRKGAAPQPTGSTGKQPAAPAGKEVSDESDGEGMSPVLLRMLVVSGVATGVTTVVFVLLAVLPFFARPGLSDVLAIFLSSLIVAAFFTVRGRRS